MNFTEISAGTEFGTVNNGSNIPLIVKNSEGEVVTDNFFMVSDNRLTIKKNTMPSMLTLDECVIRQDCLCYLMEMVDLGKVIKI
jgi:hypothetical protein